MRLNVRLITCWIVAITSNRGLCGAFNSNVIKQASNLGTSTYSAKMYIILLLVRMGNDVLKKSFTVTANNNEVYVTLRLIKLR